VVGSITLLHNGPKNLMGVKLIKSDAVKSSSGKRKSVIKTARTHKECRPGRADERRNAWNAP